MSDPSDPLTAVSGLPIDNLDSQLQGIKDALVVLAEAGIDVSDVGMAFEENRLTATVTLDGAVLAENPPGRPASEDSASVESTADEGDEVPDESDVADDEPRAVPEEVIEEPQTAADYRLAIASLAGLDDYLAFDGDKPPQFSKRHRVAIAQEATSLDGDVLGDFALGRQAEAAVLAHGFDAGVAERQYFKKDELEKIHRQLTGLATAPGVPDDHLPEPGESGPEESGEAAATDGGAVVQDASMTSGAPGTLAERLEAMDTPYSIPDEVTLAEFETIIDESTYLREAAVELGMDVRELRVIVYKLGWYSDRIREGRAYGGGGS
jgi:hypothetical protein